MRALPPDPPGLDLNYETPRPGGNAPLLLRLAAIFNFVSAGADFLHALIATGMILLMHYTFAAAAPARAAPPALAPPAGFAPAAPAKAPAGPEKPAPGAAAPIAPAPAPVAIAPAPMPPAPPPPEWAFFLMYGIPGALSLLVLPFKIIGATKILRLRKRAWGWTLATGILGCCEWWMLMGCCPLMVVPLAAGIFTIVVCCLPHVRQIMLDAARRPAS